MEWQGWGLREYFQWGDMAAMITIVKPRGIIESSFDGIMPLLERAARTCYKSEDKIANGTADKLIRNVIKRGHESVVEHASISARIICDRACSHQLVRHRIGIAISQESQRFVAYDKKNYQVICPPDIGIQPGSLELTYCIDNGRIVTDENGTVDLNSIQLEWLATVNNCYNSYLLLREAKIKPEDARSVLPNATKTELFITLNLRAWRHLFLIRGLNSHAQWQIRAIFTGLLDKFAVELPAVFGDLLPV